MIYSEEERSGLQSGIKLNVTLRQSWKQTAILLQPRPAQSDNFIKWSDHSFSGDPASLLLWGNKNAWKDVLRWFNIVFWGEKTWQEQKKVKPLSVKGCGLKWEISLLPYNLIVNCWCDCQRLWSRQHRYGFCMKWKQFPKKQLIEANIWLRCNEEKGAAKSRAISENWCDHFSCVYLLPMIDLYCHRFHHKSSCNVHISSHTSNSTL